MSTAAAISGAPSADQVVPFEERARLVERVARICCDRDLNFTLIRRRVFELLAASRVPVSAYALVDQLAARKPVKAPSVYRALEFLIENGFVRFVAQRRAYICCELLDAQQPVALLMCTGCGNVDEVAAVPLRETIAQMVAPYGFDPAQNSLEIAGRCTSCRQADAV